MPLGNHHAVNELVEASSWDWVWEDGRFGIFFVGHFFLNVLEGGGSISAGEDFTFIFVVFIVVKGVEFISPIGVIGVVGHVGMLMLIFSGLCTHDGRVGCGRCGK